MRFLIAAIVLGCVSSASAQHEPSRLRLSDAYKAYYCADEALHDDFIEADDTISQKDTSKETKLAKFQELERSIEARRAKLREQYKDAIAFPYSPQFRGYQPRPHELLELSRSEGWPACSNTDRRPKRPLVPASYQCRLDRVIFRDQRRKAEITAEAARLELVYWIDRKEKEPLILEEPPPLGADIPVVYGRLTVEGQYKGKPVYLIQDWIKGSPSHVIASRFEFEDFTRDKVEQLPIVTASNSALYSFDLDVPKNYYMASEMGPLLGYNFVPAGCRN